MVVKKTVRSQLMRDGLVYVGSVNFKFKFSGFFDRKPSKVEGPLAMKGTVDGVAKQRGR
jgi:hypothetical protein